MDQPKDGCAKPAKGVILDVKAPISDSEPIENSREARRMLARVGYEAPDFEATAYIDGGFDNVNLSDHRGKWILLCFYPGDFTFV